jgi:biopolymer transport protein ExbB
MSPALASAASVFEFFSKGGVFMGLLMVCSFVSVTVIVLRGLALRRNLVAPPEIGQEIDRLRHDDPDGVARLVRLLRNDPSPLGRIAGTGLRHLNWPKVETVEAVQTRAQGEIVALEEGLFVLEVIVGIAPLLGLLGAVSGLRKVFGAFGASAAQSDPHIIASGISEALGTTIVGLAIAIPSLIAYSYFSRKVETLSSEMQSTVAELLAKCYYHTQKRYTARFTPPADTSAYEGAAPVEEER